MDDDHDVWSNPAYVSLTAAAIAGAKPAKVAAVPSVAAAV